jgi:hypothetical protein
MKITGTFTTSLIYYGQLQWGTPQSYFRTTVLFSRRALIVFVTAMSLLIASGHIVTGPTNKVYQTLRALLMHIMMLALLYIFCRHTSVILRPIRETELWYIKYYKLRRIVNVLP